MSLGIILWCILGPAICFVVGFLVGYFMANNDAIEFLNKMKRDG